MTIEEDEAVGIRARRELKLRRAPRKRAVDGRGEAVDDKIDDGVGDDERRSDEQVIAAHAVEGAAHGVDHEPASHGLALDPGVELEARGEGFLGRAVGNELDPHKETASANVADLRVIAETVAQRVGEVGALAADIGEEIVALDHLLHRERRSAGHGMGEVDLVMLGKARDLSEYIEDALAEQGGAGGLVAAAAILGDSEQFGRDAVLFLSMAGAGAAHAANRLVENE